MPKIEIEALIKSGEYPQIDTIKHSLGKKDFALYNKYKGHSDIELSEFLLELGKKFEKNKNTLFGAEKIYKAGICYALSALLNNINGYKALILTIKKQIFFHELEDIRLTTLLALCETKKNELQSKKPKQTIIFSDSKLRNLLNEVSSQTNMLLGKRLDLAYDIYVRAAELLASAQLASEHENILGAKKSAIKLMQAILDTDTEARMLRLMNSRIAHRDIDPEYIPGKKHRKLTKIPDANLATRKVSFHWRRLAHLALASVRQKILTVKEKGREKDIDENTRFLTPEERDEYRIIITKGKFYIRQPDNQYVVCDTSHRISHSKFSYAAFTLNTYGELSTFDHFEIADRFAHSTMNAQAPVVYAGELQIHKGELKAVTIYSMHYRPSLQNTYEVLEYFHVHGVDLSKVIVQTWGITNAYAANEFKNYNALDFYENFLTKGLENLIQVSSGPIPISENEEKNTYQDSTKAVQESLNLPTSTFEQDFEVDFNLAPTIDISQPTPLPNENKRNFPNINVNSNRNKTHKI